MFNRPLKKKKCMIFTEFLSILEEDFILAITIVTLKIQTICGIKWMIQV